MTLTLVFDAAGLASVEITAHEAEQQLAHALWCVIEADARRLGERVTRELECLSGSLTDSLAGKRFSRRREVLSLEN
jgi:hypothetical protein